MSEEVSSGSHWAVNKAPGRALVHAANSQGRMGPSAPLFQFEISCVPGRLSSFLNCDGKVELGFSSLAL